MQNFSSLVSPAQAALNNAKTQSYGSLKSPNTQYSSITPASSYAQPMGTSVNTGQPTAGSITGTPTPAHPSVAGILSAHKATTAALAALPIGTPGTDNSMGTHVMTQAELDAQNAKNGQTQQNTGTPVVGGSPQAPTAPITPPTPSAPTFPGLVGSLVNTASQPSQGYTDTMAQAQRYNQALQQSRMNEAGGLAQNAENPIPLQFQQGRAQVLQSQYAQEQAALGSAFQGAASLVPATTAQQGVQQSGLTSAIGATQPSTAAYGQTVFNPLTGKYESQGGQNLDPQTQSTTFAQKVMSGGMTYDQAQSSMKYAGSAGQTMLDNAIIAAGGNPLTLQAQGTATQSNISTGGTAATSAAASGLQQSTQAYVSANTAYTAAQNQSGNLQQTMATTGINTNPQFLNTPINNLQNQLGSDKYVSFVTALSEAQQAYTSLLSSVGAATPTVNGQQATLIFNPASTPSQINAAINALNNAAYAKLKPMYDQIGTYASQLGSNTGTPPSSSSGAFSDSSFYGK